MDNFFSQLIGISSVEEAYKLGWLLNRALDIHFTKQENKDQLPIVYIHKEDETLRYSLVANFLITPDGKLPFLSSIKMIDYFLVVYPISQLNQNTNILDRLRVNSIRAFELKQSSFSKKEWNKFISIIP